MASPGRRSRTRPTSTRPITSARTSRTGCHYGFDWNRSTRTSATARTSWWCLASTRTYDCSKLGAVGNVGVEDRGTVEARRSANYQDVNVTQSTEKVRLRSPAHRDGAVTRRKSSSSAPPSTPRRQLGAAVIIRRIVLPLAAVALSLSVASVASAEEEGATDDDPGRDLPPWSVR